MHVQGGAQGGLQLLVWKIIQWLVTNDTRVNAAFLILPTVNLLLPHPSNCSGWHKRCALVKHRVELFRANLSNAVLCGDPVYLLMFIFSSELCNSLWFLLS